MSTSRTAIALKPTAGFCIKTSTIQPGIFTPAPTPQSNVLEPKTSPVPVPAGLKVFVNIAWDVNVPPPPQGSEDAIQHAMHGEDVDERNPEGWYVPVVVSNGRQDVDKELALQRIEAQTALALSRQIGTPNIAAKGKLVPRTVLVPSSLLVPSSPSSSLAPSASSKGGKATAGSATAKPLIQEVEVTSATTLESTSSPAATVSGSGKPKGILKPTKAATGLTSTTPAPHPTFKAPQAHTKPTWTWTKSKDGGGLEIRVSVPALTHAQIAQATLDIEPRRFVLSLPSHPIPVLDVNLALSDAEIVVQSSTEERTSASLHDGTDAAPNNALTLKRQRNFDVDGVRAEWRVQEGALFIFA
ncbi:hypothetical protein DXG03_004202 [Asterophora parasitica]|uniref:PIH1 N-terminal domain-containing protein n=1 Tax=Asterophora parasitica TaxID=117018 RepID=A0A9P7G927_9AGAR|nr:hypothetical protein DXG03_004202 [Asterophora parasitica]